MPSAAASFSRVPAGTGRAGYLFTRSLFLLCRLNPMNPTITCEYECCTINWTMARSIVARLFPENISVFFPSWLLFPSLNLVTLSRCFQEPTILTTARCVRSVQAGVFICPGVYVYGSQRECSTGSVTSLFCPCAYARARVPHASTLCAVTICIFRVMGFVHPLFCWWPGCIHGNIRFNPGCELVRGTWKGSDTPLLSFALSASRSDHG